MPLGHLAGFGGFVLLMGACAALVFGGSWVFRKGSGFDPDISRLFGAVSPARLVAVAALIVGIFILWPFLKREKQGRREKNYATVKPPSAQGVSILEEIERQKSLEVLSLYQDVSAQLKAAELKGYNVGMLKVEARLALGLNVPARRAEAMKILQRVQSQVPQGSGPSGAERQRE